MNGSTSLSKIIKLTANIDSMNILRFHSQLDTTFDVESKFLMRQKPGFLADYLCAVS